MPVLPESPEYRGSVDDAVRAFTAGNWAQARVGFQRAHDLSPSARTLRGLGLCAFYVADYVAAREAFEAALQDARRPLPADQREQVAVLLAQAVRETGRYALRLEPAQAKVLVDGIERRRDVLTLARGEHVLQVTADGFVAHEVRWTVQGGEQQTLDIALARAAQPATPSLPPTAALAPTPEPAPVTPPRAPVAADTAHVESGGRVFTWVALAGVPVFGGIALGLWLTGLSEHEDIQQTCDKSPCTQQDVERLQSEAHLDRYATWTTVSLVAAAAAAVTAGVLFVIEGEDERSPNAALAVGPGHVQLSVGF